MIGLRFPRTYAPSEKSLCIYVSGARHDISRPFTMGKVHMLFHLFPHSDINEEDLFPSWTISADVLALWGMVPNGTSALWPLPIS